MDLAGVRIDDYSVREAMRKIEIFLNNECMNTVETITMKTIVAAGKDETVRECLEKMDLVMAADKEILELAGILQPERIREIEEKEFFYEFMKRALRNHQNFFLLSQTEGEMEELVEFLSQLYGDRIRICGQYAFENCQGDEADIVNEINSVSPDVIISGLQGCRQDQFLLENRQKINGKIWLSLGEHPNIQNEAGLKVSWWSTLLKKTTFRRLAARFKEGKNE